MERERTKNRAVKSGTDTGTCDMRVVVVVVDGGAVRVCVSCVVVVGVRCSIPLSIIIYIYISCVFYFFHNISCYIL